MRANDAQTFLDWLHDMARRQCLKDTPRMEPDTFTVTIGREYLRVVRFAGGLRFRSEVYAFIDVRTGAIYRPSSRRAPNRSRGELANVHEPESWRQGTGPYGPRAKKSTLPAWSVD